MTPPPLPGRCSGWAVRPDVHTGLPEPDRDGWTDVVPSFDEHCDTAIALTQPETTP